jgi:hypothetical protein
MIPSTPSFSALTGVHSMNELFPLEPAAEGYERIHERVGDYLPRNAELVLEPAALLGPRGRRPRSRDLPWRGSTVHTGIGKTSVAGPQMVRRLNIEGDGQGGPEGALR